MGRSKAAPRPKTDRMVVLALSPEAAKLTAETLGKAHAAGLSPEAAQVTSDVILEIEDNLSGVE